MKIVVPCGVLADVGARIRFLRVLEPELAECTGSWAGSERIGGPGHRPLPILRRQRAGDEPGVSRARNKGLAIELGGPG